MIYYYYFWEKLQKKRLLQLHITIILMHRKSSHIIHSEIKLELKDLNWKKSIELELITLKGIGID